MTRQHPRPNKQKNVWQIQEAKSKFSQLVEDANEKGHQTITKKGEPIAVIVSKKEFDILTHPKTSFLNFFKAKNKLKIFSLGDHTSLKEY